MPPETQAGPLGVLLLSGAFERAHYAFMLAAGAGAIGRDVVLFATNAGCHALCTDWSGLSGAGEDAAVRGKGIAGFEALREAALELGATLMACDSGLRIVGLQPGQLMDAVEIAGIPAFLSAVGGGQVISL